MSIIYSRNMLKEYVHTCIWMYLEEKGKLDQSINPNFDWDILSEIQSLRHIKRNRMHLYTVIQKANPSIYGALKLLPNLLQKNDTLTVNYLEDFIFYLYDALRNPKPLCDEVHFSDNLYTIHDGLIFEVIEIMFSAALTHEKKVDISLFLGNCSGFSLTQLTPLVVKQLADNNILTLENKIIHILWVDNDNCKAMYLQLS